MFTFQGVERTSSENTGQYKEQQSNPNKTRNVWLIHLPENNDRECTITQNRDQQIISGVNASGQGTNQQGQQSMLYRQIT